jgi:hypothetical protein
VPGRDRAVFEPLRSPRTEIWSVDHFLPRRMVGVPKANMWLNVRRPFPPVRGWVMQQVMKLCAAAELGADVTILVDSDVLFVRPIKLETFQQGTKLRFYKKPEAIDVTLPRHLVWHNVARDMLGLPPAGRPPLPDYVGPLHAWDRKVVTALRDRIEYVAGRPWAHVIASRVHFSEWILYGIFVDEILGTEARVSEVDSTLCRTYFDAAPLDDEATERFVAGLAPDDVAISISAKSHPSLAARRRALARMSSVVEAPAS